jgi:hypothetical protein
MKKTTVKKVDIYKRGNVLKSIESGVTVLVTQNEPKIKGQFWGVITDGPDKKAVGVHNHFDKEKFAQL